MRTLTGRLVLLFSIGTMFIAFQNCGGGGLQGTGTARTSVPRVLSLTSGDPSQVCNLNGITIANGGVITAYQTASVVTGQTCVSQSRQCVNGVLNGSYAYDSCTVNGPASCSFNGANIPSGQSVVAYASASVAFGQNCVAETRVCTGGVLSGSHTASSCGVAKVSTCSLNRLSGMSMAPYYASSSGYLRTYSTSDTAVCKQFCESLDAQACTLGATAWDYGQIGLPVNGLSNVCNAWLKGPILYSRGYYSMEGYPVYSGTCQ